MAEFVKIKYPQRVIFPKGKQRAFLLSAHDASKNSFKDLARFANVSIRTFNDWLREKFSISLPALKKISKKTRLSLPKHVKIKNPFWNARKGAYRGGLAVYKKYGNVGGDPEYRKKKWREWWEKYGKYKVHFAGFSNPIHIYKPKKSKDLAELVGIILGDGGITKNQVIITLHRINDFKYSKFVTKFIRKI